MNRPTFLVACAAVFLAAFLGAAKGGGVSGTHAFTGDLPLDRAVQIALQQNPDILRQLQEIERTRGQIIEVRAQALPHLTATGDYTQQDPQLLEGGRRGGGSGGTAVVVVPGSTASGSSASGGSGDQQRAIEKALGSLGGQSGGSSVTGDRSWSVRFEVRQVIYAGGQVRAAINIAKFTEDSSFYQLRDTVDQIVTTTRTQFFDVLLNRALIKVQEESIQLLTDQLKDQQNRFEAGTVPRFNVLRAEVELSNARPDLIRAKNNYLIAQLQLAKTLNLDPGPQGKPTFFCVGEFKIAERPLGLTNAIQVAKERRAFLKVQRQQILVAKENIKVALAGYKPRLDVNGGYEFRNSVLTDRLDEVVNGWFYGVTGQWNIFDGLETYGKVKQARAQLESSKINYDDSVLQVELEVQQAYANLQAARETIRSQQKNVEQALEALRLANERFSAGAGTQLDVLDARVALTQARTTEIQARADYNKQLAEFDRVTATDTLYEETFHDPLVKGSAKTPAVKTKAR